MVYPLRTFTLAIAVVTGLLVTSEKAIAGPIIFFVDQREVWSTNGGDFFWRNVTGSFTETITHEPGGRSGYGSASQDTIRTQSFLGGTGSGLRGG